jgi:hypothetical protein
VTGTLPTANGGTNLTSFTSGGVVYASSSSALATGSALTFDGTNLSTTGVVTGATGVFGNGITVMNNVDSTIMLRVGVGTNAALNAGEGLEFSFTAPTAKILSYNRATGAYKNIFIDALTQSFGVSGAEGMRLNSTGLGIGTSSPASKLTVKPSGTSSGTLDVLTGSTNTDSVRISAGGTVNTWLEMRGYLGVKLYSDVTNTFTVDSAGNLGLGVTPSAWTDYKAIQLGGGSLSSYSDNNYIELNQNVYYASGSYKYVNTGFASKYQQNTGTHQWYVAASGTAGNTISFTQAMTLDASGNWMIGGTTAIGRATIVGGSSQLAFHDGNGGNTNFGLLNYGGTSGELTLNANSSGGNTLIRFLTSNSGTNAERARIDSSGNLLVGNTSQPAFFSAAAKMYVEMSGTDYITAFRSTNASPSGMAISYSTTPNAASNYFIDARDNTAQRFAVKSNGGIDNYSGNNTNLSDRREKTNFAPATSYLDKICAIPVQTFNYIDQNLEEDDGLTLGVVAQDVQSIAPELVSEGNWGTKEEPKMRLSIYQTDLQYALMKALQELNAKFEAYKASHP